MNNSTSEITNSVIRRIIVESARDLANSKLSSLDEVTYILRAMFRLRIHQIDSLGSNCDKDKLEIFQQKAYGLQFLLKADLKNSDSYRNQFTRNFKKVTREIKDKVKHLSLETMFVCAIMIIRIGLFLLKQVLIGLFRN